MPTTTLGLDIGGSSVKAALIRDATFARVAQSPIYTKPTLEQLIDAIANVAAVLGTSHDSIGLCLPGVFDPHARVITASANIPALVGLRLDDLLARARLTATRPPVITTDAHAATHHIATLESLTGRVLGVSLGTGVGACVLDDGVPLHVTGTSAGHIGQWDVSLGVNAPIAPDGGQGGLEAYVGLHAICTRHTCTPDLAPQVFTPHSQEIAALARALRIAHALYRPNHIRLLGGLGIRLQAALPNIHNHVAQHLTSLARPNWTLQLGHDDFHAAGGAALLATNQR
ncbi:MAG: ROK family protein [Phycisphaerales bacterium]